MSEKKTNKWLLIFVVGVLPVLVFGVMIWLMAAYHISAANSTAGLMDQLGQQAGGASAVLALFRFAGGAIGSGVIGAFGDSHPWTFAVMLGVSSAAMLLSLRLVR